MRPPRDCLALWRERRGSPLVWISPDRGAVCPSVDAMNPMEAARQNTAKIIFHPDKNFDASILSTSLL
jgi:hypothetical protein